MPPCCHRRVRAAAAPALQAPTPPPRMPMGGARPGKQAASRALLQRRPEPMLELNCGSNHVVLDPVQGGGIRQWRHGGHDVLQPCRFMSGVAFPAAGPSAPLSACPILPFGGLLAEGRFSFAGQEYVLGKGAHAHLLHGSSWARPWTVAHRMERQAIFVLDHDPAAADNASEWPFAYRGVVEYVLHDWGLAVTVVIENRDRAEQPVGLGFLACPKTGPHARLSLNAHSAWTKDAQALPAEEVACTDIWDFRHGQSLEGRVLDVCFTGFGGRAELENTYARSPQAFVFEADPVFTHLSVERFQEEVEREGEAKGGGSLELFASTAMPDALNRPGVAGGGMHVLAPGARLGGNLRLKLSEHAHRRPCRP
ncbi:aldose 1-epimerase [Oecophyllibacter saccharovorans]|uniref:Aldose 1-epimerase n=2 Tax=Oecophyllibacter saccharovorans TaxID=2558360 RepID=A0A506UQ75_9PROT|nr:aldose 1-epimerase [Oecophyllibacter saccharovorans]